MCAALLGNAVVLPIGGADMPVVISMLNAFTGLSAAATGVALNNPALIVAGMIVGASGSILTNLMATAMNRSIPAIVAGGFGGGGRGGRRAGGAGEHAGTVRSTSAADAAIQLAYANRVMIVPGYGMAVAQAQHAVRELTKALEARGVEVSYAIHPVAGRMPGHMNVLLAEADVPYDQLKEMDDANPEFARTDVSLVIGANDVTNPAAKNTPSSPIYGMPILEVDDSHSVIVIKRSMNPGFAGIENELYYDPKTSMLFGDAKTAVSEITAELGSALSRVGPRPSARLPVCETARVIERSQALATLAEDEFDVVVVGGGITGAGVALDAATRGYSVALLERADFASGTSSRSSKLVHGGLRYLQNFDLGLVREALLERQLVVRCAASGAHPLPLVVPAFEGRPPRPAGGSGAEPVLRVMSVAAGRRRARRSSAHVRPSGRPASSARRPAV